ncbi:ATP-binding protein [Leifsonia sp. NPDC058230]|uniref:ATP-binding protein n=1 Tax=Leifsonia sp. NPDC058230 TaxID=3346391 RepID=UPI0036DEDC86
MSLIEQISAMIETPELQWRAEKMQVVNWGGFHGHASAEFGPEVTLFSGQSGAGKSTFMDGYIALMMPPNVPFNGASNDSGGGRARSADQRNLLSYLRGKLDDTLDEGEVVDDVMRGQGEPTWGAVAMTFVSDAGERFTAMRAYFVPARASRTAEISMRMMVINDAFDLRELEAFARIGENHFPPRELKAAWPEIRTFDSYSSFAQALYVKLGIGTGGDGTNALRLLARIQASEDIPTVDRLYKELVIEKPDSYEKADAAIEHFDRLEDVYQEMVTAQARADLLEPITNAYEALVRAQKAIDTDDELGSLDATNTPAGLWRLRRHSRILRVTVDTNRTTARDARVKLTSLVESEQSFKSQLEAARKAHSEQGGDLLIELGSQIEIAAGRVSAREDRRSRLVSATMVLNAPMATQEEFEHLQQTGRAFVAEHEVTDKRLEAERDEVLSRSWPVQNRLKEIREELKSFETRAGRVDQYLHDMRKAAAEASGLAVADLPFVAELIDVMPDEEHWRTAIETALYGGARLMLVPLEHLEHFSRAIDPLHLKGRLNFEGVARSQNQQQPIFEPDRVAGKLLFKDSPYQSWVTEHVSHQSRNALCVSGPGQLNGEGLRVTPAGQTRRGRGGSHGRQSSRNVIGFDNTGLREELTQEKEDLDAQLADIDVEAARIASEIKSLGAKKDAYARITDEAWTDLDVATAVAEKDELTRRRDEIRDNNDVLAELDRQITQLDGDLEDVQRDRHQLEKEISELEHAYGGYVDLEDEVNPVIARIENEGVVILRDELAEELDNLWARVLLDEPETPESFDRQLKRLRAELERRASDARSEVTRLTQQIETIFKRYQAQWDDSNLGTTIEFHDDYAAILDEIVRSGLRERREEWRRRLLVWSGEHLQQLATALTAAIEEIEDRLDPINQILRDLPFGATSDRLFIDLRRLQPDAVVKFRRELALHARMATTGLGDEQLEQGFKDLRRFMAQLRRKDDVRLPRELVEVVDRDRLLDVRRHVEITAQRRDLDGEPLSIYRSLQGKSGGEMQELIAFIVGSALRFQLGDQQRARPRFAPVFLDEGFIKADGQFTSRAVQAWRGLGFQLIIGAPVDKAPALEPHADVIVEIAKNLTTHRSYVLEIRGLDDAGATA